MSFTDTYKISKKAYDALKKIKQSNITENQSVNIEDKVVSKKKYHTVFNIFNEDKFNSKITLEMYIYNNLLTDINESEKEYVTSLISSMLHEVKSIYEFINIEPKLTGFKNVDISSSKQELVAEAQNVIDNHLKNTFFNLSRHEREIKYKESVVNMTYDIVENEKINVDDALEHSHKVVVIENLIYNINFPYVIRHKIKEVMEDDMYNDFFDVEQLSKSIEEFESKNRQLSRIIVASKRNQTSV
jgi:hypothetical protein